MTRSKDVIFAEHADIHPAAVENAHVAAAGVVALADPDGVESVGAAVVARPGRVPRPDELVAWVGLRCGAHHAPTTVRVVDELPTVPSGKLDRAALRRRVAAGA